MTRPTIVVLVSLLIAACGESKTEEPEPVAAKEPVPAPGDPVEGGGAGSEVAEVIILVPKGGSKKSISFPHKMHADPSSNAAVGGKCEACHHEQTSSKKAQKCTTSGCHDDETAGVPTAKDAFHKTCRDGCHKEVRASRPDNAKLAKLRACTGCHAQ